MRKQSISFLSVTFYLMLTGCQIQANVLIGLPQDFQANTWNTAPGEAQSTVTRYTRPSDGTTAARILISNDTLTPYMGELVPQRGTVAFQDIGSNSQRSSTLQPPPT